MHTTHDDLVRALTVERFSTPSRSKSESPTIPQTTATTSSPPRLLLRVEEVAAMLDVGRTRVYELIRTGGLASVKIGGSRRVLVDEVRRYVHHLEAGAAGGIDHH